MKRIFFLIAIVKINNYAFCPALDCCGICCAYWQDTFGGREYYSYGILNFEWGIFKWEECE